MNRPFDVALDANVSLLFVAENVGNRVSVFDLQGNFDQVWRAGSPRCAGEITPGRDRAGRNLHEHPSRRRPHGHNPPGRAGLAAHVPAKRRLAHGLAWLPCGKPGTVGGSVDCRRCSSRTVCMRTARTLRRRADSARPAVRRHTQAWGEGGTDDGQLNYPQGICVDGEGGV